MGTATISATTATARFFSAAGVTSEPNMPALHANTSLQPHSYVKSLAAPFKMGWEWVGSALKGAGNRGKRKRNRKTQLEANLSIEEDTVPFSIIDAVDQESADTVPFFIFGTVDEEREETIKHPKTSLQWLRALFKRKAAASSRYRPTRAETAASNRSNLTRSNFNLSRLNPTVIFERCKRGLHWLRAWFVRGTRESRQSQGVGDDREWSSSHCTGSFSRVASVAGSRVHSSGNLSIVDTEQNPSQLPQVDINRIYRPLKDHEIRLLEILPGDEEPLCCRLDYTSLTEPGDYNTLSYTWGDKSRPRIIIVNGYPLQVTENCESALQELRREVSFTQKRQIIWIDAICINQTDVRERTQQVQLMKDIYQKCQKLIVWLGPEEEGSANAIQSLKEMTAFCENGTIEEWIENFFQDPNYINQWNSIGRLVSRPWFTRAWVLQEYIICATKSHLPQLDVVEFYCGKDRISPYVLGITKESRGQIISMISRCKHKMKWVWGNMVEDWKVTRGQRGLLSLFSYSVIEIKNPIEFFNCVLSNLHRSATDPRDHIYAYLGFCKSLEAWPMVEMWENRSIGFSELIVDYEASIEDVFSSLVQLVVSATGRLDVLSICYKRNSQMKTSWAIDLLDIASFLDRGGVERDLGLLNPQFQIYSNLRLYSASKDKVEKAIFSEKPKTLCARGFRFNLVKTALSSGSNNFWEQLSTSKHLIGATSMLLSIIAGNTIEGGRQVLWDVSVGGTSFENQPEYYESWIKWLDTPSVSGLRDEHNTHEHWTKLMDLQTADRTLFLLNGWDSSLTTHIGKGWKTMQKNDIVCIIFGCDVPLVLRPVDDHFILIGDCYVEGIMQGQAMDLFEKGEFKEEEFTIR